VNPFNYIIADFYGDTSARFGLEAAAVLLLRVLAAGYAGTMPSGANPYKWALQQLSAYAPNDFANKLATDWHAKADPHI
jgi:hypothetical protein